MQVRHGMGGRSSAMAAISGPGDCTAVELGFVRQPSQTSGYIYIYIYPRGCI
jgi:hypothetical protein